MTRLTHIVPCLALLTLGLTAGAQETSLPTPEVATEDQQTGSEAEAPHPLAFMFGEWTGKATGASRDGSIYELRQTERVGTMLDGDVVVIEGRGYDANGETAFNAFAIASPTETPGQWQMRSYMGGRSGTFPMLLTDNGFIWTTPAGPDAKMVYTATFIDGVWKEVGEYRKEGQPARPVFSMELTRKGDTDWPAGNPVDPGLTAED